MTGKKFLPTDARIQDVRKKRAEMLVSVWEFMLDRGFVESNRFNLSLPLADEVIEHYISDWVAMKVRYRIPERIMPHKIAGLMAASIIRYKPINPICERYIQESDMYVNEKMAIIHGLAICGHSSLDKVSVITEQDWFQKWCDEFMYLLRRRNHTPESLVFVFQTLTTIYFNMPSSKEEDNSD
jgi:hypothetical protein